MTLLLSYLFLQRPDYYSHYCIITKMTIILRLYQKNPEIYQKNTETDQKNPETNFFILEYSS